MGLGQKTFPLFPRRVCDSSRNFQIIDQRDTGSPVNPVENGAKVEQQEDSLPSTADPTPPPTAAEPADGDTPMIVEVEREEKTPQANPQTQPTPQAASQPGPSTGNFLGGLPIDICSEASKLPLDVAIFNSARACGGDDKIRKYLQAVLVIGGGAHTPGMAHALESRYFFSRCGMRECGLIIMAVVKATSHSHSVGSQHG